jgi:hypothetical protein
MPRKVRIPATPRPRRPMPLVEELAKELKSGRASGQPFIEEEHFKTGAIRVLVLWDKWDHAPQEERSAIILEAYRKTEGEEFAGKIGLVSGLTFPEAHASGMLPFQIIAALRRDDPVTVEQCREAMIEAGASTLLDPDRPQLWFASEEEAEACRRHLSLSLPGSEQVWVVTREVGQVVDLAWDVDA